MKFNREALAPAVCLILAALISFFVVAHYMTVADTYADTIQVLDEKRATVLELTAAATAVSTAITLLPGDAGTPIAEKLVDLSSYFLLVLSALVLEKYMLTVTGYLAFRWLIPIGCLLLAAYLLWGKRILYTIASKLLVFGLAIVLIVPVSVRISNLIDSTYESSIRHTIDNAVHTTIEEEAAEPQPEAAQQSLLGNIINGVSELTSNTSAAIDKARNSLNSFIEALAIMLVTTCIIPLLMVLLFVWLCKLVLGIDIPLPIRRRHHRVSSGL